MSARRPVMAIVGSGASLCNPELESAAERLGAAAIASGFRIATGGLGGVMDAASRGAKASPHHTEGSIIAVLPSYDRATATAHADIVIATGQQIARNVVLVASADIIVALGGGAGTLSEIAIAWQLRKPIIALSTTGGWAEELAGRSIDKRSSTTIVAASSVEEAVTRAMELLMTVQPEPGEIGSGWKAGQS